MKRVVSGGQWPGWAPWMFPLFTLGFLSIGGGAIIQSVTARSLNARFDQAERVEGTVESVTSELGNSSSKHGSSSSYHVDYQFKAANGVHRDGTAVTEATYRSLHPGDPVAVKYLPYNPNVSRLDLPQEEARYRQDPIIELIVGILFWVVSAVIGRQWLRG